MCLQLAGLCRFYVLGFERLCIKSQIERNGGTEKCVGTEKTVGMKRTKTRAAHKTFWGCSSHNVTTSWAYARSSLCIMRSICRLLL